MPELQLTLTEEPATPSRNPCEVVHCTGGCERDLALTSMHRTPEGWMCGRCISDLYTECEDCGRMLRYDSWGECADLRIGPDDRRRCYACDSKVFSVCTHCGRHTFREGGNVRTNPNDPTEEYCCRCWDAHWFLCSTCRNVFPRCEGFNAPRGSNHYCEECFETRYFQCASCSGSFNRRDMCGWDGDPYCEQCYGHADVWKTQPWSGRAITFNHVGSERCYGVELETDCCGGHRDLHGETEWGCVYECSTPGREFISPILQGDEGFAEIRKMCGIAERERWTVDRSCGLHIHIDARDFSSEEMLQVVYAYRRSYPLWKKFVDRNRADNSMCGSPQYSPSDVRNAEHIEDFVESRDRFEFVNWRSYLRHGSIEIRLYRGSLNAREICNWIALHTRFVDAVKDLTFDEIDGVIGGITRRSWRGLVELIGDADLLDYWRRIAARCGNTLPALWKGESDINDDSEEGELVFSPGHCGSIDCGMCDRRYGYRHRV